MKAYKYLGVLTAAITLSFSFVSCGDEENVKPSNEKDYTDVKVLMEEIDHVVEGKQTITSLNSTEDNISFSVQYQDFVTIAYEAEFNADKKVKKCVQTYTFATEKFANYLYEDIKDDIKDRHSSDTKEKRNQKLNGLSYNGNMVTYDRTWDWGGFDYDVFMQFAQCTCEDLQAVNPFRPFEYEFEYVKNLDTSDSTMIVATIQKGNYETEEHVVKFGEDGHITSYIITYSFPTAAMAKEYFDSMSDLRPEWGWTPEDAADEISRLSLAGRSVSSDRTIGCGWEYFNYESMVSLLESHMEQFKNPLN